MVQVKNVFTSFPNQFGIYSAFRYIPEKIYNIITLERELKKFESTFSNENIGLKFDFVQSKEIYRYSKDNFRNNNIIPSSFKQFRIQCYKKQPENDIESQNTILGLIIHEKLATALKIKTYFRRGLKISNDVFEMSKVSILIVKPISYTLYA